MSTSVRDESLPALVRALAAVARAATAGEVAAQAVAGAAELTGARGAALGVRDGEQVRLLAATGYDCDSMAAGATLPMTAALPITEAVRTGRTVVQGQPGAPPWVAVPLPWLGTPAALLVSVPPHAGPVDVAALQTLGGVVADALARCPDTPPQPRPDDLLDQPTWLRIAAVHDPADRWGGDSGDVVVSTSGATADVCWLVVADVCGSGSEAAPTARWFRDAVTALTAAELGPAELLGAADRALRRAGFDRFVTAAAIRLRPSAAGVEATVATAGHPPALVWHDGEVEPVPADGLPLNLLDTDEPAAETVLTLGPADLLLVHTDGLIDRGIDDRTDALLTLFTKAGALGDPVAVLDAVAEAMTAATDRPRDDVAAAVLSPGRAFDR